MDKNPFGILPEITQPWGFDGVRRETRGAYGDSRAFYVNPNHLEANDMNSGEDPAHPLETIQRAVTLARAYMGDTIYVMSNDGWQYGKVTQLSIRETVVIPSSKPGIALIGVGRGPMGVYWVPANDSEFALTIEALDVVVDGFCFWDGGLVNNASGIFIDWVGGAGAVGENTIVRNCTFEVSLDMGIQMEFAWYCKIENNHFDGCQTYGVYIDPAGNGIKACEFRGNWFQDCAVAMAMNGADDCLIVGNMFYNANAQGAAVATNEGIDTTAGQRNIITGNYFSCVLPVPANGDWDDLNTGAATDAWIGNICLNGIAVSTPT